MAPPRTRANSPFAASTHAALASGGPVAPSYVRPASIAEDAVAVLFAVPPERAGMRLDKFLVYALPRLTRTRANRIAREYAFTPSGTALSPAKIVRAGETIVLFRPAWEEPEAPSEIPVLYEDGHLIAVDKPANLPVHPTARVHRNTLLTLLNAKYTGERIALAHRLDKETSGVLVAARTLPAEIALKEAFAGRRVRKVYLALVHGVVRDEAFSVDAPMRLAGGEVAVAMEVCSLETEGALTARTEMRVVERLDGYTLVECAPQTGRQHQIRVHLAHVGHPIVGDKLYAHGPGVFLAVQREGITEALGALLELPRHALHAHRLTFPHPEGGDERVVEARLPADMAAFADRHRVAAAEGAPRGLDATNPG